MFGISGENLTRRLRSETFKKMLSMEIEYFDKQENNVGALCTKLAMEASAVQGVSQLNFKLFKLSNEISIKIKT